MRGARRGGAQGGRGGPVSQPAARAGTGAARTRSGAVRGGPRAVQCAPTTDGAHAQALRRRAVGPGLPALLHGADHVERLEHGGCREAGGRGLFVYGSHRRHPLLLYTVPTAAHAPVAVPLMAPDRKRRAFSVSAVGAGAPAGAAVAADGGCAGGAAMSETGKK